MQPGLREARRVAPSEMPWGSVPDPSGEPHTLIHAAVAGYKMASTAVAVAMALRLRPRGRCTCAASELAELLGET